MIQEKILKTHLNSFINNLLQQHRKMKKKQATNCAECIYTECPQNGRKAAGPNKYWSVHCMIYNLEWPRTKCCNNRYRKLAIRLNRKHRKSKAVSKTSHLFNLSARYANRYTLVRLANQYHHQVEVEKITNLIQSTKWYGNYRNMVLSKRT